MKIAFIYPISSASPANNNPYIQDFVTYLSKYVVFINKSKPSKTGILNLFFYFRKIDFAFFNWIEDLPDRRGGLIQSFLLILLVPILKRRGIKIFYTLHNKESHYNTNKIIKRFLRTRVLNNADYILYHSSEGFDVLKNIKGIKGSALHIPHPFKDCAFPHINQEKKYDILIWGAIRPYKGIDAFLEFLVSKNMLNSYKTLIIGKILPEEYVIKLNKYKSDSVQIVNEYVEDEALKKLINQSKIILFTYHESSILSSGALIYSLSLGANIIGPNTGAFKDIFQEDLIETFNDYEDLLKKIDVRLNCTANNKEKIIQYIKENSWENFSSKVFNWISEHEKKE